MPSWRLAAITSLPWHTTRRRWWWQRRQLCEGDNDHGWSNVLLANDSWGAHAQEPTRQSYKTTRQTRVQLTALLYAHSSSHISTKLQDEQGAPSPQQLRWQRQPLQHEQDTLWPRNDNKWDQKITHYDNSRHSNRHQHCDDKDDTSRLLCCPCCLFVCLFVWITEGQCKINWPTDLQHHFISYVFFLYVGNWITTYEPTTKITKPFVRIASYVCWSSCLHKCVLSLMSSLCLVQILKEAHQHILPQNIDIGKDLQTSHCRLRKNRYVAKVTTT